MCGFAWCCFGCLTWVWGGINWSVNLRAETSEVVPRGHMLNGLFRQLLHSETFASSGNLTHTHTCTHARTRAHTHAHRHVCTRTHAQGTIRDISNLDPLWKENSLKGKQDSPLQSDALRKITQQHCQADNEKQEWIYEYALLYTNNITVLFKYLYFEATLGASSTSWLEMGW